MLEKHKRVGFFAACIGAFTFAAFAAACGGGSSNSPPPVNLAPPTGLSYPSPLQATVGIKIVPLAPQVTGEVASFAVSPALPTGLSLDGTTGVISGTPAAITAQATYTITAANAAGSTMFGLPVTVIAAPTITLSSTSLTFANQLLATTSAAQVIGIINSGSSSVKITGIAISGTGAASFAQSNECGIIFVNGACFVDVTFTPSAAGSVAATLAVTTDGPSSAAVNLFGAGVPVEMSLDKAIVPAGGGATLTWSAPNAASCNASGSWSGAVPASGSQTVTTTAAGYYTYMLNCGSASETSSVVLTAHGPTPPVTEPANEVAYQAAFYVAPANQIVGLQTVLTVPPEPPTPTTPGAALFLWPGLGPATNSANFLPINDGVLQPVLSWGPSCAPTAQPSPFTAWWISAQYVNTFGDDPGYTGCFSGNSIYVNPGDALLINMTLDTASGIWTQSVADPTTSQGITFDFNLQAQGQNWAYFAMEEWYDATISTPVTFTNTVITFQSPDSAGWCSTSQGADNAYIMTPPTPQNSGTQCFISSIVVTQP